MSYVHCREVFKKLYANVQDKIKNHLEPHPVANGNDIHPSPTTLTDLVVCDADG